MIFVFWMLSFKPTFSLSSFTFIKRLFNFSSLSAIRVVSSAYLRLLIFLPAILIPACASSSPVFLIYAYKCMHIYYISKRGYKICINFLETMFLIIEQLFSWMQNNLWTSIEKICFTNAAWNGRMIAEKCKCYLYIRKKYIHPCSFKDLWIFIVLLNCLLTALFNKYLLFILFFYFFKFYFIFKLYNIVLVLPNIEKKIKKFFWTLFLSLLVAFIAFRCYCVSCK